MTARLPDDLIGLARYAIGRPWWGWRLPDGPAVSDRGRLLRRGIDGMLWVDMAPPGPMDEWLPDLTDGATIGCLLSRRDGLLTRRTCPDPVYTSASVWGLHQLHTMLELVKALDAAWDATGPSR